MALPPPLPGQPLVIPGDITAKLPPKGAPAGLPPELQRAWLDHMVNGFKQNQQMFDTTLQAFMKPYRLTVRFYSALFIVGIGLFVAAAIIGLTGGSSVTAIAFGGLGAASFITLFMQRPLQALEENLEFITWLGVAFNTYWTRLMYMDDPKTVGAELKAADDDFRTSVEKLIEAHAKLRGGRANPPKTGE